MKTVPQLTAMVGMEAPRGSASKETISTFFEAVCAQDRSLILLSDGDFELLSQTVVCYTRRNGSGHCVLRVNGRCLCFQHSDDGRDVTSELAKPGALIRFGWVFIKRTAALLRSRRQKQNLVRLALGHTHMYPRSLVFGNIGKIYSNFHVAATSGKSLHRSVSRKIQHCSIEPTSRSQIVTSANFSKVLERGPSRSQAGPVG
jgi:hypothetical protein